ncbi:hypothetical protein OIU79_012526 [Salix purpurea]|uniref:Uncharacterized protein n=1 Tax=Salix purpurea TaxID=77065 RepID=A0A9Q0Q3D9_SALPP|nr:hypothetical protein OIU79_012526 [Salix purpurea]
MGNLKLLAKSVSRRRACSWCILILVKPPMEDLAEQVRTCLLGSQINEKLAKRMLQNLATPGRAVASSCIATFALRKLFVHLLSLHLAAHLQSSCSPQSISKSSRVPPRLQEKQWRNDMQRLREITEERQR